MQRIPRRFWTAASLVACTQVLLACCYGTELTDGEEAATLAARERVTPPQVAGSASTHVEVDISEVDTSELDTSELDIARAESAVAASLPFLAREGRAWMDGTTFVQEGSGCVSCHQVPFALWGQGESRRAGLAQPGDGWAALGTEALAHAWKNDPGRAGILAPLLLADVDGTFGPGDRAEVLRQLVASQERDGRWRARGQFPSQRRPLDETDAVITLWTLLAVHDDAALSASRERALAWLASQDAPAAERSSEWLGARALLARKMADDAAADLLLGELRTRQNDDGGWGFRPDDPSDAMTTGQVLYALSLATSAATDDHGAQDSLRRGTEFLLAGQQDDGSWSVPSRLLSNHPSERGDYVYDVWGTAWAAIGLASLPQAAGRPVSAVP